MPQSLLKINLCFRYHSKEDAINNSRQLINRFALFCSQDLFIWHYNQCLKYCYFARRAF